MSKKHSLIFCYLFFLLSVLKAEIRLPAIFSENMVLQRDVPIKIWGWADNNEEIEVHFINQVKKVKANKRGEWSLQLDPMPYGGPYLMHIKGRDSNITLKNILIGEVWLASGQSNMEWTVKDVKDAPTEIRKADYPQIRAFNVEKALSPEPKSDLNGMWQSCSPATVGNFSAVAYFFARKLYVELGIPVGIINSS
jgi:sialate O-acetylesterase